jgi:hypothetical protein
MTGVHGHATGQDNFAVAPHAGFRMQGAKGAPDKTAKVPNAGFPSGRRVDLTQVRVPSSLNGRGPGRGEGLRPSVASEILLARPSRASYLNHPMHPTLPATPVGVVAISRGTCQSLRPGGVRLP